MFIEKIIYREEGRKGGVEWSLFHIPRSAATREPCPGEALQSGSVSWSAARKWGFKKTARLPASRFTLPIA